MAAYADDPLLRSLRVCTLLASTALLASCGAFTAGVVASADDDGGGNAATVGSDLSVTDPNDLAQRAVTSPAAIRFRLTDQEGDLATVRMFYSLPDPNDPNDPNDPDSRIEEEIDSTELTGLATDGSDQVLEWNFGSVLGHQYEDRLTIRMEVVGGISPDPVPAEVGNDAPVVSDVGLDPPDSDEYGGNVGLTFYVSDSAGDPLDVTAEFTTDNVNWDLMRPAGNTPSQPTLDPNVFDELPSQPVAEQKSFSWDSVSDLAGQEIKGVGVRITAKDGFVEGVHTVTLGGVRIDNNEPPFTVLDAGAFVNGIKDRGNIPIRFTVRDDESDEVQLAIQWRAGEQAYPLVLDSNEQPVDLTELSPVELRDLLE
ncbi:MAG: hypothetical protein CMJ89_11375, partial [Planctomycetes bacterium]|nr:hypothetical protein [Planctomycetota bacterium]